LNWAGKDRNMIYLGKKLSFYRMTYIQLYLKFMVIMLHTQMLNQVYNKVITINVGYEERSARRDPAIVIVIVGELDVITQRRLQREQRVDGSLHSSQ